MTMQPLDPVRGVEVSDILVVDLDHSLVSTDTLVESALMLTSRNPLALAKAVTLIPTGRAQFKRFLADRTELDFATLPYNRDVIAYIEERRAAGTKVYLVTAADQSIADGVAEHLGLFDGAIGSDGVRNIKGSDKAAVLAERIGTGFDYIGDSTSDLAVWAEARQVLVVGRSGAVERGLRAQRQEPARRFPRPGMDAKQWIKALRLHQWSKNLLLFVPVFLSQDFRQSEILQVALGVLAFGLVASATYLLNDMNDLKADRAHFGKRYRAFASGRLPIIDGVLLSLAMLAGGMLLAFALEPRFGLVLLGYLALTVLYSIWLKAEPLVDVMVIGALFTIRVHAGLALTHEGSSLWLTSFSLALFASLALAKRHSELVRAAAAGRDIVGRGYRANDAPMTVALGIAMASVSIVVMLLYLHFDAAKMRRYGESEPLFIIALVLSSWLLRVWVHSHRGELHDDPVIFALKDKVSLAHAGAVALLWVLAVTMP